MSVAPAGFVATRLRRHAGTTAVVLSALLSAVPAGAQLRPYDPAEWELFDGRGSVSASLGVERYEGQRASLAGERGTLTEVGTLAATARTGRVLLSAAGTMFRTFDRDAAFASPYGGAATDPDGRRSDAGDFRVATTLRLSPPNRPALAILRFGTRLPTTDNRVGLERDQTDFFAILGGRVDRGPVRAIAEAGVGLHGTREPEFEQSDVLVYVLGLGLPRTTLAPAFFVVGHADGMRGRNVRGNEELAEARLRVRGGGRVWLQSEAVIGLTEFSPDWGLRLSLGTTR